MVEQGCQALLAYSPRLCQTSARGELAASAANISAACWLLEPRVVPAVEVLWECFGYCLQGHRCRLSMLPWLQVLLSTVQEGMLQTTSSRLVQQCSNQPLRCVVHSAAWQSAAAAVAQRHNTSNKRAAATAAAQQLQLQHNCSYD